MVLQKKIQVNWKIIGEETADIVFKSEILRKHQVRIINGVVHFTQHKNNLKNGYGLCFKDETQTIIDYCISSPTTDFIEPLAIPFGVEASYELRVLAMDRPKTSDLIQLPKINISLKYEDSNGKIYQRFFTVKSHFYYLPDSISSSDNPISEDFFSEDNIRGSISFIVMEL